MAQVLSQEEVLDFLCRAGGKASNAALLRHFGRFLRDPALPPEQRQRHRDCFKRFVNSVAVVKQEAPPGSEPAKIVVLRARYRDLLGEDDLLLANGGGDADPKEDWGRESTELLRLSPKETTCASRTIESPRTFIAACRSEDIRSQAHTCLGGPQQAESELRYSTAPLPANLNGLRAHDAAESSLAPGHRPGIRLPPSALPACPTKGYIASTRGTCLPCPPHSSDTYPSCSPAPGVTSPLCHLSAKGASPPFPSTTDFPPCVPTIDRIPLPPSSSCTPVPIFLPLRGNSPPCPLSLKSTSPTCVTSSKCSSSPVLQFPGGSSSPCPPSLKANCRTCPTSSSNTSVTCPLAPERIPYFEPPLLGKISTQNTAYSDFKLPVCRAFPGSTSPPWPPSPGSISPPCSPSPRSISPAFPPLDLYTASKDEEWLPAYRPPFVSSPPVLPGDGMESGWWGHLPVFKSIRCQLSLQDLDGFVDQATNDSLDSDSSSGSDSVDKNQLDLRFGSAIEGRFPKSPRETSDTPWCDVPLNTPSDHLLKENRGCETAAYTFQPTLTCSTVLGETTLISDSQALVLPLTNKSQRVMKTEHSRYRPSSSVDELMDFNSECRRKSRRPTCTKKAAEGTAPDLHFPITLWPIATNNFSAKAPDVDLPATFKPVATDRLAAAPRNLVLPERLGPPGTKHLAASSDFVAEKEILGHGLSNDVLWAESKKPSVVPLDPKEHDWVVKLASGSWMQVYGLFNADPHLALQRDFISGYTALHWIAKHGNCQMFENFVSGAEKAGIKLDVDVKSSSGYTALHLAAIHGHVKLIKLLVEKLKVKVSMRDHSGKKAWQYLSSTTTGEVWQLLGAPRGKTIFPVCALPTNPTACKNPRSRSALTHLSRKTSLAAFLKPQHLRWKSHVWGKSSDLKEVYSD